MGKFSLYNLDSSDMRQEGVHCVQGGNIDTKQLTENKTVKTVKNKNHIKRNQFHFWMTVHYPSFANN